MGRPEGRLDSTNGPVTRFAHQLRKLRADSGGSSYRDLARRARYSASALSEAAAGKRLATWPVVEAFVRACGVEDVSGWRQRWLAASGQGERTAEPPGRIPDYPTSFIGRGQELTMAIELLSTARLVTITGPGGVGKTRLAQRAALAAQPDFPDGAHWVELAEATTPEMLPRLILAALDVQLRPDRSAEDQLLAIVPERRMLLVLDNCEHLAGACARLVRGILSRSSGVTVLATSRHTLSIPEEHLLTVGPLEDGVAVALLTDRVRAVLPGFELTVGRARLAAKACRRLDGLPLAIELAARRLRMLSLEQLVDRLGERLALLSVGTQIGPRRHGSLAAMLEWSFGLCTPAEQEAWCALSVFVGQINLEAIEAVCVTGIDTPEARNTPPDVLDVVARLVDQSIVAGVGDPQRPRLTMLETVREFGLWQLGRSGRLVGAKRRHLTWYRDLAEAFDRDWYGPHQARLLAEITAELPNLRVAMEYGLHDSPDPDAALDGLHIARSLLWYWVATGAVQEGLRWLEHALRHEELPEPDRTAAMFPYCYLTYVSGDPATAAELAEATMTRAAGTGQRSIVAWSRMLQGLSRSAIGDPGGTRIISTALADFESLGIPLGVQETQAAQGIIHTLTGDAAAATALNAALDISRQHGERFLRGYTLWTLAMLYLETARYQEALDLLREALEIHMDFHDRRSISVALETIAWIACHTGADHTAAMLLGCAYTSWPRAEARMHGCRPLIARGLEYETHLRERLGDTEFAARFKEGAELTPAQAQDLAAGLE